MVDVIAKAARENRPPSDAITAGVEVCRKFEHEVASAFVGAGSAGNRLFVGVLPAGHEFTDFFADVPELDDGSALVLNVGVENSNGDQDTDVNDNIVAASTVGQAGGLLTPNVGTFLGIRAADFDRRVYVHVGTAAGTAQAGTIRGWLKYVASQKDRAY